MGPFAVEAAANQVAAAECVRAAESNDVFVVETHAVEHVTQVLGALRGEEGGDGMRMWGIGGDCRGCERIVAWEIVSFARADLARVGQAAIGRCSCPNGCVAATESVGNSGSTKELDGAGA